MQARARPQRQAECRGSTSGFEAVDDFVKAQMLEQNIPGLAIAIVRNGRVLFIAGYGAARDGEPVTPTTQFRLASLSKSFTAVAALQLVEAGKVLLDAPVSRYVPEFAAGGQSAGITVRQLLNQTSGLADTGFTAGLGRQDKTLAERSANLRSARLAPVAGPNNGALFQLGDVGPGDAGADHLVGVVWCHRQFEWPGARRHSASVRMNGDHDESPFGSLP